MSQHQQPAAELIANALAKIKKLAGGKKHAELAQRCQQLIDSIQEVRDGFQAAGCSCNYSGWACAMLASFLSYNEYKYVFSSHACNFLVLLGLHLTCSILPHELHAAVCCFECNDAIPATSTTSGSSRNHGAWVVWHTLTLRQASDHCL